MKLVIDGQTVEVPGGGGSDFPSGGIIIWSGAADNIPSGWALCDGQNGTPDLRKKFVFGAGSGLPVGNTGGSMQVTLTENEIPPHRHVEKFYSSTSNTYFPTGVPTTSGVNNKGVTVSVTEIPHIAFSLMTDSAGGGQPHDNMPPYYALCYIMKL